MKIFKWVSDNILFIFTIFFLIFIPLYPKRPLLDIQHTWVYIRVEDFAVGLVVLLWIVLLLLKRVTLKTPLTLPIMLFWVIGGIATLHGVLLVFPVLSDVFSNVALLSYLRRIEYMSLFFIAYASMRDKKFINYVIATLVIVLLLVVAYGFGQRFLQFPAFLTMNEEFAKGLPIQLSSLSRIPSTFAGHYDLAAYLVLILPLIASLIFAFKNWFMKFFLMGSFALGFALLFMTVSRVSFFVLILSLVLLLLLQKKKLIIASLFGLTVVFLILSPSLLQRFGDTVSEVDVLVDAITGEAIGHVKEVPASYFDGKTIIKQYLTQEEINTASSSAILYHALIPQTASLIVEANNPTGENLPQGTAYVNLPLSSVVGRTGQYFFEKSDDHTGTEAAAIRVFYGDYVIKKALAYDLSFTTRFQGEWPRTIDAFKRNIFLGNGYGSVSLAVDNNYLRILGETGLLGFFSFLSIFIMASVYIKKVLPKVESPIVRSFVFGFIAGTFGLALNAILIDVFEASKIAFTYWLLMGVVIGVLHLYKNGDIDLYKEFKKALSSSIAVVMYLFVMVIALFSSAYNAYFVGDDYTWLRWVSDCSKNGLQCDSPVQTIINYFIHADGFFYRPGTKIYFLLMNFAFWLNQAVYHFVSILLHFSVVVLLFFIAKRVFKNNFFAAMSAVSFLILSGNSEAIYWISSTGFLFNAVFTLLGLLFFIYWKEKKKIIFFILSLVSIVLSLLFHELGVIAPLFIILYDTIFGEKNIAGKLSKKVYYLIFLFPIVPYLLVRFMAQSHWFNGDYSYNMFKLPFNIIGNILGYLGLAFLGPISLPLYEALRNLLKDNLLVALPASLVVSVLAFLIVRGLLRRMTNNDRRIVIFGFLFFIIALLPFLCLGNITSRYSYLSSIGSVIILVFVLEKIYHYLIRIYGRYIGILCTLIIVLIFSMTHLFQLQRIQTDWNDAGEKAKKFFITLDGMYDKSWTKGHMRFYFVNTPIRSGEAWIFPVGLRDAVWFAFRNENIAVYQVASLDEAFNAVQDPLRDKVFKFDGSGGVVERHKLPVTSLTPIIK